MNGDLGIIEHTQHMIIALFIQVYCKYRIEVRMKSSKESSNVVPGRNEMVPFRIVLKSVFRIMAPSRAT